MMDWINFKEKRPQHGELVIGWYYKLKEPGLLVYEEEDVEDDECGLWSTWLTGGGKNIDPCTYSFISHWMPLPKPPKE